MGQQFAHTTWQGASYVSRIQRVIKKTVQFQCLQFISSIQLGDILRHAVEDVEQCQGVKLLKM
jgi:hypothetical protein